MFFVNVLRIDDEIREIIRTRFEGAIVVYFGENGIVRGESAGAQNIEELFGVRLSAVDPGLAMEYNGREFRGDGGAWAIEDSDAEPIARYENGQTAVGARGNLIFSTRIIYEKDIITDIIKKSGARIYSDDCVCAFAAGRYAAVYFATGGEHTVRLDRGEVNVVTEPLTTLILDSGSGEIIM